MADSRPGERRQVVKRSFEILNKLGLHARAAAQLVQLAASFQAEVTICKDGQSVNGKSIMGIMTLAAGQGSVIDLEADGPDAEAMLDAIGALIAAKFHEGQ
ncbi:MAG: HPr family phosphocarrier protein [Deltaproteobacteria bacterium]|nr:HPr family phosphocarrier protein [Deltaproteobacteria bacterium]